MPFKLSNTVLLTTYLIKPVDPILLEKALCKLCNLRKVKDLHTNKTDSAQKDKTIEGYIALNTQEEIRIVSIEKYHQIRSDGQLYHILYNR